MAIAHAATEYLFTDFVLKEPSSENRYKGIRLDLALDKMVTCVAVGLPLLLISLAFAQEVSVGTQISCFSPTKFSWRQAAYVDSYCWAAVQTQDTGGLPLWLHKFFPYVLLLVAVSVYMPALFWRFTGAPVLSSDLTFIMEELDRSYNGAIKLSKCLYKAGKLDSESARMGSQSSVRDLTESFFKYPLVEQYLRTKRSSRGLVIRYLLCRTITLLALVLACIYLCYYIRLSITDEFQCDIRTGAVLNDSSVPPAMQCKLVAVGIFQLLSYINLCVYLLLVPLCLYAMLVPFRRTMGFLKPYEMLPTIGVMQFGQVTWDDQALYLLFLEENLSELKSYKYLKVLELLKEEGDDSFDTIMLLQTLGQVKTDVVDGRLPGKDQNISSTNNGATEMKEMSPLLQESGLKNHEDEKVVRQRVI
ncbi:pannexin-1-like [Carassius auratus]|uniref:Pannexin-1-like n=1 Tax=Carassius auratus TaxID=7957 RepID=A0A6P6LAP8_CARAU|nr:pannexin-1-like [Carassius auratus]XP_026081694.1 pannexin-1-like [Carassius auratus]XP_052473282.1 pannexin-1 [Carassius gibelio]